MSTCPPQVLEFIQGGVPGTIVSRETICKLEAFVDDVLFWQEQMNLISANSISHIWNRHVLDSLQLLPHINLAAHTIIDLGSGGGFPAIPLSIFLDKKFILIEATGKKCAFLKNASRHALQNAEVWNERIETIKNKTADVITSRALASLLQLLTLAFSFCHEKTELLFLKGEKVDAELELASKKYTFDLEKIPSLTSQGGAILKIWNLRKK